MRRNLKNLHDFTRFKIEHVFTHVGIFGFRILSAYELTHAVIMESHDESSLLLLLLSPFVLLYRFPPTIVDNVGLFPIESGKVRGNSLEGRDH